MLQFTGSEQWYRHGIVRDALFTDGPSMSPTRPGPIGFLDEIALAQRYEKSVAAEEFQLWKLNVNSDHTATLACEDGNGNAVYRKAIEYTEFPLPEIMLYFTNNVILLPIRARGRRLRVAPFAITDL